MQMIFSCKRTDENLVEGKILSDLHHKISSAMSWHPAREDVIKVIRYS